jgi:hypothetical protein
MRWGPWAQHHRWRPSNPNKWAREQDATKAEEETRGALAPPLAAPGRLVVGGLTGIVGLRSTLSNPSRCWDRWHPPKASSSPFAPRRFLLLSLHFFRFSSSAFFLVLPVLSPGSTYWIYDFVKCGGLVELDTPLKEAPKGRLLPVPRLHWSM